MYSPVKNLVLELLKAPKHPPETPAGTHDSVQVFRASPRYLTYRLLVFYLTAALVCVFLLGMTVIVIFEEGAKGFLLPVLIGPPLLFALFLAYFLVRIDYELRYYIVTDRSLRVREGAWLVKEQTITYANVQNLRVVQGPLQRIFGIWDLRVDTAGGGAVAQGGHSASTHRVKMAGIENAHEVRDLVLSHLRRFQTGTGLGDPDDVEAAGRTVFDSPRVTEALRAVLESASSLHEVARGADRA